MVGAPSARSFCDCSQGDVQTLHVEHTLTRTLWEWQTQTPSIVYDILRPTTAIVDFAIGLEKLSASERFFHDTQTAVSL